MNLKTRIEKLEKQNQPGAREINEGLGRFHDTGQEPNHPKLKEMVLCISNYLEQIENKTGYPEMK